ncbi:MAG: YiiX/YebB-like N1pC/P60 family cysteine hydrolase [Candidatus Zixiibacteriota bacterium]
MKTRTLKWLAGGFGLLVAGYAALLIPGAPPPVFEAGEKAPFAWNADIYWTRLENGFKQLRATGCGSLKIHFSESYAEVEKLVEKMSSDLLSPDDSVFVRVEDGFFRLGMLTAVCQERLTDYITLFSRLRRAVKEQSRNWDMADPAVRDRLYRLLYGGRMAVEEVILQAPEQAVPNTVAVSDEPSKTPAAAILGVSIRSGDILVSRGGAPTSALIARGNDYPGNFSHIALAHVDSATGVVSIIESHIECGVAVAGIEDYLRDTKLRVMILRLRRDLLLMLQDPLLPHRAATFALSRARSEHIPYDFAMNFDEPSKLFCSEVVSNAYARYGVTLWTGLSHISSPGVKNWLAAFGVKNFVTQEPSDLEYDPQLRVVAEWRDYETLLKDRLDNAVVDIMLERAEHGELLKYDWYLLPAGRLAKACSAVLNLFGGVGPVPEGMDASAALRNERFSERHRLIKQQLTAAVGRFKEERGYFPPYWELVKLARQAVSELDERE